MPPIVSKNKFDKLKEIKFYLNQYYHWEVWFQSDYCWLWETEKLIIFNLLYYKDIAISANQMRLSHSRVNDLLNKAIRKFSLDVSRSDRKAYKYWESLNLWAGSKDPRITSEVEEFINAPIDSHTMSPKLLNCLKMLDFKSIAEILEYRYDDFNTFKGFDIRLRYEFDLLLVKNKCYFLLKKTYPEGKKWSKTLAIEHLQDYYSGKKVVSIDLSYGFGEKPVELNF